MNQNTRFTGMVTEPELGIHTSGERVNDSEITNRATEPREENTRGIIETNSKK